MLRIYKQNTGMPLNRRINETQKKFYVLFLGIAALIVILLLPKRLQAYEPISKTIQNSVVKISVIAQLPDYNVPWNPGKITPTAGTGFFIGNNRILTNAHVSSNARFISVEKEDDSRKYEARVKFIAHDCDLALLEVLDESFYTGMIPMSLGRIPSLDSTVTVIGYPIGGNRLSVTRGIVSRIDYQLYSHSSADSHLAIQIDAAINPGNSGGPVLQKNGVVGVAFQAYSGAVAQNVGYMIPVPVIQRFLTDVTDGHYDRYVDLGIYTFPLLNDAHRRAVGLKKGDYGVSVGGVISAGAAAGILSVGDVLLAIDDLPIFSDGYVEMDGQRVQLIEVVERKFKGDKVRLKIQRDRKQMEVTVPLNLPWPYLMQSRRHDVRPRFVLFGGLIFQPLSYEFLKSGKVKDVNILYHYSAFLDNEIYLDKPEIIVLSRILPDSMNTYLAGFGNSIVHTINDKKIRTLEDVTTAFKQPSDYYVIRFVGQGRPLVLERKAVTEARERILRGYGVLQEIYLKDSIVPEEWLKSLHDKQ
ncbi:trypsin-like peptidase domain-containing protein [Thermodesulfobacteriota bacterium]